MAETLRNETDLLALAPVGVAEGTSAQDVRDAIFSALKRWQRTVTTTPVTVTINDLVIRCDATSAPMDVNLLSGAEGISRLLIVKKVDASANAVTIVGTIDGATNLVLDDQYDTAILWGNGTNYDLLAHLHAD